MRIRPGSERDLIPNGFYPSRHQSFVSSGVAAPKGRGKLRCAEGNTELLLAPLSKPLWEELFSGHLRTPWLPQSIPGFITPSRSDNISNHSSSSEILLNLNSRSVLNPAGQKTNSDRQQSGSDDVLPSFLSADSLSLERPGNCSLDLRHAIRPLSVIEGDEEDAFR